jgi:hypothetical protein
LPASQPSAPAASNAGISQSQGAYRPGSTARNAAALGTTPAAPSTSSGMNTGGYPLSSPTTSPTASGSFSYPTTGQ